MKRVLLGTGTLLGTMGMLVAPTAQAVASSPVISHAPMIRATAPTTHGHSGGSHGKPGGGSGGGSTSYGWASSNWSGYALGSQTNPVPDSYNSITGQWVVPSVTPSTSTEYSSTWIGIDGFNNSNLIQTGTEQDTSGGGTYYAWWEILPAAETEITTADNGQPATVHAGDTMTADIQNLGGGQWSIQISDTTAGWTFTTKQTYSGPAESAEWIEEAPTIGGHVATLADYGSAKLDPGTVNGVNPGLTASELGVMVQKRTIVSYPSNPDGDTDGFVAQYGSTQPTPPAS